MIFVLRRGIFGLKRRTWRFNTTSTKENLTAMGKELQSTIKLHGKISMHQFMRNCLVHPIHGYYNKDVFGQKGDFTTNPEISQVYGELIGIWFVKYYQDNNMKDIQLVELGPGRGTLMSDILTTLRQFPFIYKNIKKVAMVDSSLYLQGEQKKKLADFDLDFEWFDRLQDVPNATSFYIAHEFFDALPIYQFQVLIFNL